MEAQDHIRSVHAACKPSEPLPGAAKEAARELLGASHSYQDDGSTTVRSYDRGLLSIPAVGAHPVPLESVLPQKARRFLVYVGSMLKEPQEWGHICEEQRVTPSYMDPKLRFSLKSYHGFISDLFDAGLISWSKKVRGRVSVFCVTKKSGKLRLVVDCRATNTVFRDCPHLPMGSGGSWGEVILDDESDAWISSSDIKDYFYACGIPQELSEFFCLPDVPGSLVRLLEKRKCQA